MPADEVLEQDKGLWDGSLEVDLHCRAEERPTIFQYAIVEHSPIACRVPFAVNGIKER